MQNEYDEDDRHHVFTERNDCEMTTDHSPSRRLAIIAFATLAVITVVLTGVVFAAGAIYSRVAPCTANKVEATQDFKAFLEGLPEVEEVVVTTHDCDSGVTPQVEITATDKDKYWARIKSSLECTDAPRYPEESRESESLHCVYGDYTYLLGWGSARIAQ